MRTLFRFVLFLAFAIGFALPTHADGGGGGDGQATIGSAGGGDGGGSGNGGGEPGTKPAKPDPRFSQQPKE